MPLKEIYFSKGSNSNIDPLSLSNFLSQHTIGTFHFDGDLDICTNFVLRIKTLPWSVARYRRENLHLYLQVCLLEVLIMNQSYIFMLHETLLILFKSRLEFNDLNFFLHL